MLEETRLPNRLRMTPVRILVDSLADQGLTNSQMTNAREIIRRLDSDRFHVSVFCGGHPDRDIERRPNTRLVPLPLLYSRLRPSQLCHAARSAFEPRALPL